MLFIDLEIKKVKSLPIMFDVSHGTSESNKKESLTYLSFQMDLYLIRNGKQMQKELAFGHTKMYFSVFLALDTECQNVS